MFHPRPRQEATTAAAIHCMAATSKRNNTMGIEICFISVFEVAALTIT